MADLRLLVLIPSLPGSSPGSRFRIEQWLPYLERGGVSAELASFEDEELHSLIYKRGRYFRKARLVLRALARRRLLLMGVKRRFDAVFVFEEAARLGPALLERWIARQGVPIVYDFCDPIWIPYISPRNRYLSRLKFPGKTATLCRMSRCVLAGNNELATYARQFNRHVTVVPITIDTDAYLPRGWDRLPDVPTIGWTGSHSTVPHLDTIRAVLTELAQRRRFRLRVLGTPRYLIPGVDVEARDWSLATEVADLSTFDIGIMPLPDDQWTRLRSHLKVRQYMGLGIPSVVSPVGVNRELIEDGVNGYLAGTSENWLAKLTRLLDDHELRCRMGRAGRRTVESRYSARDWSGVVGEVLLEAAGRRTRRSRSSG